MRDEVIVAITKGIADFGQHCPQLTGLVMAEPETDRIEDEAQHARKSLQHHLAVGCGYAFGGKQAADPGFGRRTVAGAAVAIAQRQQARTLDAEPAIAGAVKRRQRQCDEEQRIDETVGRRALLAGKARMHHRSGAQHRRHAALLIAAAASCHGARQPSRLATAMAEARPSS